jgi:hypothetical protein
MMYHIARYAFKWDPRRTSNKRFRIDRPNEVAHMRSGRVYEEESALNRDGWPILSYPRVAGLMGGHRDFLGISGILSSLTADSSPVRVQVARGQYCDTSRDLSKWLNNWTPVQSLNNDENPLIPKFGTKDWDQPERVFGWIFGAKRRESMTSPLCPKPRAGDFTVSYCF